MGLLDRNGLYGAARFHMEATRCGVQAHIGAEVSISDLGQRLQPAAYLPHQFPAELVRLSFLAESRVGYQNLSRLITQLKLREKTKAEGAAILVIQGKCVDPSAFPPAFKRLTPAEIEDCLCIYKDRLRGKSRTRFVTSCGHSEIVRAC